jgi:hypothetical protein
MMIRIASENSTAMLARRLTDLATVHIGKVKFVTPSNDQESG